MVLKQWQMFPEAPMVFPHIPKTIYRCLPMKRAGWITADLIKPPGTATPSCHSCQNDAEKLNLCHLLTTTVFLGEGVLMNFYCVP